MANPNERTNPNLIFSSDTFIIPLLDNESNPRNVFSSIFNILFDNVVEYDRMNEAIQNSLNTYNEELFKRVDDVCIDLKEQYLDINNEEHQKILEKICFICLEKLDGNVYILNCNHVYHKKCLDEAVSYQHFKCSLCNETIPTKNTIKEEYENENGHKISLFLDNV